MSFFWNPYLADNLFAAGHRGHPLNPKYVSGFDDEDEEEDGFGNVYYNQHSRRQPSMRELKVLRQQEAERKHREHLEYQRLREQERLREVQLENQRRIREVNLRRQQEQAAHKAQQARKSPHQQQGAQRTQQSNQKLSQLQKQKQQEAQREALLMKKVAFLRLTHAAKVIQRRFRIHTAERKHKAARVIQDAWKAADARKQAKEITQKLAHLRTLAKQLDALRAEHEDKVLSKPAFSPQTQLGPETTTSGKVVLPNKEFLVYEDALLKFMIKLDSISSGGSEFVRDVRKSLVAKAQLLLNTLDRHRTASTPTNAP